jgi:hypothetical protein
MRYLPLLFLALTLSACSAGGASLSNEPSGVWRNDTAKVDYHFTASGYLTIVRDKGSSDCTTDVRNRIVASRTLSVWFKCPTPDWPGYAEEHDFIYSADFKTFMDTMYIQGVAQRVDGDFKKITP